MPIRFLFDEHLRVRLLAAVARHNAAGGHPIDATQVGDPPDLPLGTPDPDVLAWAAANDYVLVTRDVSTMTTHLVARLAAGGHSPGVIVFRSWLSIGQIVAELELIAHAGDPADYADTVTFIP